jgi:hypothetical protein
LVDGRLILCLSCVEGAVTPVSFNSCNADGRMSRGPTLKNHKIESKHSSRCPNYSSNILKFCKWFSLWESQRDSDSVSGRYCSMNSNVQHLTFVDPCIIVQLVKKNPTRCNNVSHFIIPRLYGAQHVSGDTPPIIRSLKLRWQPLVFHTRQVVCTCSWWTLSGTLCTNNS